MAEILPSGAQVGGYVIQGMLGKGGMGTVYRAMQVSIGRSVALKVLHPARMTRPGAVERFLAEARIAAGLQHSSLVTIHEAGQDPTSGLVYYSMEYIHGRTLSTALAQEGPLPPARALDLTGQIAGALAAAHDHGLVHRDVKPANVLLDQAGRARLTDLGLALDRVGAAGEGAGGWKTFRLVGTACYSPPEQLRNPDRAGPASDIYALGGTLLEMLTGEPPFTGETLLDLVVRICTEDPPRLTEVAPSWLQDLLARLLAKDPADRPADGRAAQTLLAKAGPEQPQARSGPLPLRRRLHRRK